MAARFTDFTVLEVWGSTVMFKGCFLLFMMFFVTAKKDCGDTNAIDLVTSATQNINTSPKCIINPTGTLSGVVGSKDCCNRTSKSVPYCAAHQNVEKSTGVIDQIVGFFVFFIVSPLPTPWSTSCSVSAKKIRTPWVSIVASLLGRTWPIFSSASWYFCNAWVFVRHLLYPPLTRTI